MSKKFKITVLNAAKIIERIKKENLVKDANENFCLKIQLDLLGNDSEVIIKRERHPLNALFWQILKSLNNVQANNPLVFVDFKEVFEKNFTSSPKSTPSKKDLLHDTETALKEIFANGMELSFDGGYAYRKFVAFDKSNSMARNCVISFIDEELKETVDKRLMLGMDLSNVKVVLSKYYSYRGMYLSSARRVNSLAENDEALDLDEEKVIVLPDFRTQIIHDIFTAKKKESLWECFKKESEFLNLNSFDGEGLISPEYADRINAQLKLRRQAHSFQIRLPFTKGVLHEVNFAKFFAQEFNCKRELWVKDIFGIERNLMRAKIILTESMFKCGGWIKEWSTRPEDPMKYFFEKMRLYDHALWVCNTDANLRNNGKVSLNYQFLSTLALISEEFESLVEKQIELIEDVPKSLSNIFRVTLRQDVDEENFEGEFQLNEGNDSVRDKCLSLLRENDAFLKDPKVKAIVNMTQRNLEKELCLGKFEVQGEVRFLSCDLAEFLLRIAKNCNLDAEKISQLETQTLLSESFYMPERKLAMKHDKYYAFLRSPHLSRNEQCLLRPLVKRGNIYDKYFSHLTGVVMVSCKSAVPAALGGADFDGDLVKVISEKKIIDAVKRGVYAQEGKILKRRLPIIEIPSIKSEVKNIPSTIPFEVIKNTFSNQVGSISNLAVKFAKKEYSSAEPEAQYQNKCAECTIIVGLEIDAAKNGVHPSENISQLKELAKEENSFLKIKEFWDNNSTADWYTPQVVEFSKVGFDDGGFGLYTSKKNLENKKVSMKISSNEQNTSQIELLPLRYLQYMYNKQEESSKYLEPDNEFYFNFETSETWRADLTSSTKKTELKELVQAFVAVKRLAGKVEASRKFWAERRFDSFVKVLLAIQYDTPDENAFDQMFMTVTDALTTIEEVNQALELMKKENWHLTHEEERRKSLAKILNLDSEEILPEVVQKLSTFRDKGFMLLFYLLNTLKTEYQKSANTDKFIEKNKKLSEMKLSDNKFWIKLYEKYCEATSQKISLADVIEDLAESCRESLEKIFKNDINEALKYFWSIRSQDSSRDFLWRVFKKEELRQNVYKKGGEKNVE